MPSTDQDFRIRCGCFVPVFMAFMLKRAKNRAAMRYRPLQIKTRAGGVIIGCLLTLLFWGGFLLQCGDIEQNPGPPKSLRQSSLISASRRVSVERGRSNSTSTLSTASATEEPTLVDVVSMLQALNNKFDEMKGDMKDIRDCHSALQAEVLSLKEEVGDLRLENQHLRSNSESMLKRMQDLEKKTDDLEGRSKRNNVIFHGLHRSDKETHEECAGIVNDLIVDKLELARDIQFDRVHRLNSKPDSPVIARCTFFKDKELILKAKRKLKGSRIFIGEDFSRRVRDIRKKLNPFLKKARSESKRATMIFDHLLIDGMKYGLDDEENLRVIR
eukprot:TRINITY_DN11851_c0_g1_i1.p1 TRINITY_DN11851_c0_g1~~TRINITY_DN11851_c0_g1_i1.p1  ORF type:complete len:329 (+),score=56.83 TRINITY_DN11851_c0_g1_i1:188-1174(+)